MFGSLDAKTAREEVKRVHKASRKRGSMIAIWEEVIGVKTIRVEFEIQGIGVDGRTYNSSSSYVGSYTKHARNLDLNDSVWQQHQPLFLPLHGEEKLQRHL